MGAVLCSHYYSVLTTLHRTIAIYSPSKRIVTAKSTVKAVSSARSCILLAPSMKHVVPPSHHLVFFIQHLFSSNTATEAIAQATRDKPSAGSAPSSTSPAHEQRCSVTIGTIATGPAPGRVVKGQLRRNQSRDQSTLNQRLAAVSPYRVDTGKSISRAINVAFTWHLTPS
jgi:hypothetical protein